MVYRESALDYTTLQHLRVAIIYNMTLNVQHFSVNPSMCLLMCWTILREQSSITFTYCFVNSVHRTFSTYLQTYVFKKSCVKLLLGTLRALHCLDTYIHTLYQQMRFYWRLEELTSMLSRFITAVSILRMAVLMALGGGRDVSPMLMAFDRLASRTVSSFLEPSFCCNKKCTYPISLATAYEQ